MAVVKAVMSMLPDNDQLLSDSLLKSKFQRRIMNQTWLVSCHPPRLHCTFISSWRHYRSMVSVCAGGQWKPPQTAKKWLKLTGNSFSIRVEYNCSKQKKILLKNFRPNCFIVSKCLDKSQTLRARFFGFRFSLRLILHFTTYLMVCCIKSRTRI